MNIPEAAIQAVAEKMMDRYEQEYTLGPNATWRDWADFARQDIEAALPHLIEGVGTQADVAMDLLRAVAAGDLAVSLGANGEPVFKMTEKGKAAVEAMGTP